MTDTSKDKNASVNPTPGKGSDANVVEESAQSHMWLVGLLSAFVFYQTGTVSDTLYVFQWATIISSLVSIVWVVGSRYMAFVDAHNMKYESRENTLTMKPQHPSSKVRNATGNTGELRKKANTLKLHSAKKSGLSSVVRASRDHVEDIFGEENIIKDDATGEPVGVLANGEVMAFIEEEVSDGFDLYDHVLDYFAEPTFAVNSTNLSAYPILRSHVKTNIQAPFSRKIPKTPYFVVDMSRPSRPMFAPIDKAIYASLRPDSLMAFMITETKEMMSLAITFFSSDQFGETVQKVQVILMNTVNVVRTRVSDMSSGVKSIGGVEDALARATDAFGGIASLASSVELPSSMSGVTDMATGTYDKAKEMFANGVKSVKEVTKDAVAKVKKMNGTSSKSAESRRRSVGANRRGSYDLSARLAARLKSTK